MSLNYEIFKKHIISFDHEKYINSLDKTFIDEYHQFYDFYLKLIKDEIENTKLLNAKFSNNLKEKGKYSKFNRSPIEFKKVCSFESIDDENEKLNIIIRTYLNKVSNDTYEKVSDQLVEKLLQNKNTNIFRILSEEIVNKCIFDYKYRNLYINLCSKIWNNKKIHYNLTNIIKNKNIDENNDEYYAEYYINDNLEKIGPYNCIDKLKENVFKKLNFKNFFIDFLQEEYYSKDLYFDHLNDEQFFNKKKKTLLLVELLSILFIEKHINFDIINLIIIDLLHQDNNFDKIKEIEFELLYVMIKFIYQNNKSFKFIEYKKIIDKFKNILEDIAISHSDTTSKRSKYFIDEITIIFNKILKNEKYVDDKKIENSIDNIFEVCEKGNINDFNFHFQYLKMDDKKKLIIKLVNKFLENTKNQNLLKILSVMKSNYLETITDLLNKIINNLDDIILDIPNINKNITLFIESLELDETLLIRLEEKMSQIDDESDDDDFSFR